MSKKLIILILALFIPNLAHAGFYCDGIDDIPTMPKPSALTLGTDSFTACVEFYWQDGPDTTNETLISQADGTGTGRSWIYISDSGGDVLVTALGGTADPRVLGSTAVTSNTDHVACLVSDEGSGTVALYLDGVFEDSETKTVEAATGNIRFCRHKSNTTEDYEGRISHFWLYESALTADEIALMYKSRMKRIGLQIQPSTILSDNPLDDELNETSADGDTFRDITGNGNTIAANDGANNTGMTANAKGPRTYT